MKTVSQPVPHDPNQVQQVRRKRRRRKRHDGSNDLRADWRGLLRGFEAHNKGMRRRIKNHKLAQRKSPLSVEEKSQARNHLHVATDDRFSLLVPTLQQHHQFDTNSVDTSSKKPRGSRLIVTGRLKSWSHTHARHRSREDSSQCPSQLNLLPSHTVTQSGGPLRYARRRRRPLP